MLCFRNTFLAKGSDMLMNNLWMAGIVATPVVSLMSMIWLASRQHIVYIEKALLTVACAGLAAIMFLSANITVPFSERASHAIWLHLLITVLVWLNWYLLQPQPSKG